MTWSVPLPLRVQDASFENADLTVAGDLWVLHAICDWTYITSSGAAVHDASSDTSDAVWELIGDTVVNVQWRDESSFGFDPQLTLASGARLLLRSDAAFDSWTIRMSGLTLVGPLPSE